MNKIHENDLNGFKPLRKLSGIEARMAIFHNNLNGSTQGTQVIGITSMLSIDILKSALYYLYQKYVPLQCNIQLIEGDLHFCHGVKFESIPFKVVEIEPNTDFESAIGYEVDQSLHQDVSLWKVTALVNTKTDRHKILITAHHAIIDANGMNVLAKSLFKIISTLLVGNEYHVDGICEFPKPVDDLLKEQKIYNDQSVNIIPRQYDQYCSLDRRQTGWKALVINQHMLQAVLKRAEQDKLKIHSVISAAMCLAVSDSNLAAHPINFNTAVSLRFLQRADTEILNDLGCYMSIAKTFVDTCNESVSSLAKKYDRELLQKIMTLCIQKSHVDQAQLDIETKKLAHMDCFAHGVGITNLGVIDIPASYEGLEITDYMMLANRVAGNFSVVAHCYEFLGRQYINFVYPKPLLSDATVNKLCDAFSKRMEEYCSINVTSDYLL